MNKAVWYCAVDSTWYHNNSRPFTVPFFSYDYQGPTVKEVILVSNVPRRRTPRFVAEEKGRSPPKPTLLPVSRFHTHPQARLDTFKTKIDACKGRCSLLTILQKSRGLCSLRKQPTFGDATTGFPAKWRLRNEGRNSILMTRHYPDLGSASDWSCRVGNLIRPIRSTTQIWVVTHYQYGISALVSSVAKCRLLSQARDFEQATVYNKSY